MMSECLSNTLTHPDLFETFTETYTAGECIPNSGNQLLTLVFIWSPTVFLCVCKFIQEERLLSTRIIPEIQRNQPFDLNTLHGVTTPTIDPESSPQSGVASQDHLLRVARDHYTLPHAIFELLFGQVRTNCEPYLPAKLPPDQPGTSPP
jgi:hypothetical protein